jgi:uncharacterized membrane protein
MRRLLLARTLLVIAGVVVWGYGYRVDDGNIRLAAIGILAVALLLRFVPKRWSGDDQTP